jgi:hypothetical protein
MHSDIGLPNIKEGLQVLAFVAGSWALVCVLFLL